MTINISLRDLVLAELRARSTPLDRAEIEDGMDNVLTYLRRCFPPTHPHWLKVQRQNLYDVETVISLEVAQCNANRWLANEATIVYLYEKRLLDLGFDENGLGAKGNNKRHKEENIGESEGGR
ncbi:hypothetical protein MIND_00000700 [Mycena indigotica]|uniref:Uncharacterized protein n=1 Tax=Mycena indigotica TaxID=2126181 RepID=A0A8H6T9X7_9AGAR|nr:uncharacterized protein MIND_00000700 [Mycena indigotica]KAF7314870.1 hypothetical protein MIND_00000700 [Mycena indigotica]